jgi:hypothetical protein
LRRRGNIEKKKGRIKKKRERIKKRGRGLKKDLKESWTMAKKKRLRLKKKRRLSRRQEVFETEGLRRSEEMVGEEGTVVRRRY